MSFSHPNSYGVEAIPARGFAPQLILTVFAVVGMSGILTGCASTAAPAIHSANATSATSARSATSDSGASGAAQVAPTTAAAAPPLAAAAPVPTGESPDAAGFHDWLASVRSEALARGIRAATLEATLDQADFLPDVIARDRFQPEFVRPVWSYLDSAVSPSRVRRGKEVLAQFRREADASAARYGVPASVIVAIWGIESNYGSNFGSFKTVDALATLGFEGRRQTWARAQLLDALTIVDRGDIAADRMVGSWAGAMGNTQFLPSNFLRYAVDADGDGRRDIWGSVPDVLASTARFLQGEGWQAGQPWGQEIVLPEGFDLARANALQRKTSAQWAAEGVRPAIPGETLASLPAAALLLPAGASGPSFLVGDNFRSFLRYNNSTSYALAVGLLSNAIEGAPALVASWPRGMEILQREEVRELQSLLNARGFNAGDADGIAGPATAQAVRQFQQAEHLPADGFATQALLQRLRSS